MCINLAKIITNVLFAIVFFRQVFGLQRMDDNISSNDSVSLRILDVTIECSTPTIESGFCIQAQNCNLNYTELDEAAISKISCGPRNQNKKKPFVCCDWSHIVATEENISTPTPEQNNAPEKISPSLSSSPQMCGTQIQSRIVGGIETEPEEFPWMVRLMRLNRRNESTFSCTGALIGARVVLTTAHCITNPILQSQLGQIDTVNLGEFATECKFGQKDCLKNQKVVKVSKLITHPKYVPSSRSHKHDVGLIILADEVEFTPFVSPICLLEEPYEASTYVVSGWGKTEFGTTSTTKLKTVLMPYAWQQCVERYRTLNITVTSKQICAGGVKGKDSCQGDSGGPLMVEKNGSQWFIAGIVSFGVGCGAEGWPGVYASVPSYINWIKEELNKAGV